MCASERSPRSAGCLRGRRAVERTFAWLTAHHRLARDYEREPAVSEVMIRWAAINTITRRLAHRKLILSNTL